MEAEKRTNQPGARNRILQAALKVFAEKSFEGSRIDEIAAEAGVPKSLIYYHFKNKSEMLEVLIQNFLAEYRALLQVGIQDTHHQKAGEILNRTTHYRSFYASNVDLIRVILIESLKKSSAQPVIYQVAETFMELDSQSALASGPETYDPQERLIAEFFTNIIPLFAFLCFHNSWSPYFNIEPQAYEALFTSILAQTHGAYHQKHS
jgi:AcrR family transcriptional regulator